MKKLILLYIIVVGNYFQLWAQNFLNGLSSYSKTTEAYLTLNDGTEYTGNIYNFNLKKVLFQNLSSK